MGRDEPIINVGDGLEPVKWSGSLVSTMPDVRPCQGRLRSFSPRTRNLLHSIVSQLIEFDCDSLVCAACCQEWLEVSGDTSCSVSHRHQLKKRHTRTELYDAHKNSNCTKNFTNTTLISLARPALHQNCLLKKVAENLVRRLLAERSVRKIR